MNHEKIRKTCFLVGLLDCILIGYWVIMAVTQVEIPFFHSAKRNIEAANAFGGYSFVILAIGVEIIGLTLLISAVFLMRRKWYIYGLWVSAFNTSFRIFLVLPPSFFFVVPVLASVGFESVFLNGFLVVLDILKLAMIIWLIKQKCYLPN